MANLQDVQFALGATAQSVINKTEKSTSGIVPFDPKNPPKKEKSDWIIFKLVESNRKGGVYIPSVDDVYNPETDSVERIRLLAGVNSIWQKDQKDVTPEYAKKNLRNIEFPRGVKIRRVSAIDKTTLEFMRRSNSNVGNIKRVKSSRFEYFEYDPAIAEKELFEKETLALDAAIAAKQEPLESMKKHAKFLGLRLVNDLGEAKSEEGIRQEYVRYASKNYEYFNKTKGSKEVEISWMVEKAILDALIDVGGVDGSVTWSNGGGQICFIPKGETPKQYLTQLAMTNTKEGIDFKEQLEKFVK